MTGDGHLYRATIHIPGRRAGQPGDTRVLNQSGLPELRLDDALEVAGPAPLLFDLGYTGDGVSRQKKHVKLFRATGPFLFRIGTGPGGTITARGAARKERCAGGDNANIECSPRGCRWLVQPRRQEPALGLPEHYIASNAQDGSTKGEFRSVRPGTAQLTATADPSCRRSCGLKSTVWQVNDDGRATSSPLNARWFAPARAVMEFDPSARQRCSN